MPIFLCLPGHLSWFPLDSTRGLTTSVFLLRV